MYTCRKEMEYATGDVMDLKGLLRVVPDFPKEGINFIDITTLIKNPAALDESVRRLADFARKRDITTVSGIESRGFIFGAAVARELGVGFVPVRKPGKLPWETYREEYSLEYGTNAIEIHRDAFDSHDRVFIVDDLLATGGTMQATASLVEKCGAAVAGIGFVVELTFLDGRRKLDNYEIISLVTYDD